MSTHYDLRTFECPTCKVSFSRKWTLKKHIYTHTGEKPFACDSCGKRFADKSNLTTHLKKHLNEYPDLKINYNNINFPILTNVDEVQTSENPSKPSPNGNENVTYFKKCESKQSLIHSTNHNEDMIMADIFPYLHEQEFDGFEKSFMNFENSMENQNLSFDLNFFNIKQVEEKEENEDSENLYELFKFDDVNNCIY